MNEVTIKSRIETAIDIRSAPKRLVDQTVLRVQGIVAGRSAEQRSDAFGTVGECGHRPCHSVPQQSPDQGFLPHRFDPVGDRRAFGNPH